MLNLLNLETFAIEDHVRAMRIYLEDPEQLGTFQMSVSAMLEKKSESTNTLLFIETGDRLYKEQGRYFPITKENFMMLAEMFFEDLIQGYEIFMSIPEEEDTFYFNHAMLTHNAAVAMSLIGDLTIQNKIELNWCPNCDSLMSDPNENGDIFCFGCDIMFNPEEFKKLYSDSEQDNDDE